MLLTRQLDNPGFVQMVVLPGFGFQAHIDHQFTPSRSCDARFYLFYPARSNRYLVRDLTLEVLLPR